MTANPVQAANAVLTDGTGVSKFTLPKVVKDLVIDFVKTLAVVFTAMSISGVQQAIDDPHKLFIAVVSAIVNTGYRFVLSLGN